MAAASDETTPIHKEAQRLSRLLSDMQGVLRSQREILRRRGMNLPSGVLTDLQDAHIRLEKLVGELRTTETELDQLRALAETTALINSSLELDEVLNRVMDTVIALTGAERGYLLLRDPETNTMEPRVARNLDREAIEESSFTVSRSVVNSVAETGQPVVTTNAQSDPRFASQESIVSYALRSILCVPLTHKGQVSGVVYADNRIRAGLFGEHELELLVAFANQAAVAIENARLFDEMRVALVEITELKDLWDNVFASIASGVIITSSDDRITAYNKAASEILNIVADGVIGRTISDVLPSLADGLLRLLEAVRTENRRTMVELTPELDERGPRNLNLKLSPLRNPEEVTEGVAIVFDDLTELRQREAQLNVVKRYLPPAMVENIKSIAQLGLGGVRRHVTAVYVDVRPINTFSSEMGSKELMAALNSYMAVSSDPIHHYGGVIDKYMGTEIMALFNTQLNPSEDHAWQAIQAVLAMVNNYQRLYAEQGEPPGSAYYRIGVHSGIATMGNVGSLSRREFTAIGFTVNIAHRLVDLAQRGEIVISQDTFALCAERLSDPASSIQVVDRGQIDIRGSEQPVRIYQLSRGAS